MARHGSQTTSTFAMTLHPARSVNSLACSRIGAPTRAGIEPRPAVREWNVQTLRTAPLLTLETSEGRLDLIDTVAGVGDYAACLAASESVDVSIEGRRVRFRALSLEALIRAKRATGRRKTSTISSNSKRSPLQSDRGREPARGTPRPTAAGQVAPTD